MVRNSGSSQVSKTSPNNQLSKDIRKLVLRGKPILSEQEKVDLDCWVNEFKLKRFGKQGFESWIAEKTAD
ncbi:MAG: hypothetical protein GF315_14935 [candidate division Zixibacteria bacterium]|nr:hypothetical protein [candidate division Zixibacteria bacterium]